MAHPHTGVFWVFSGETFIFSSSYKRSKVSKIGFQVSLWSCTQILTSLGRVGFFPFPEHSRCIMEGPLFTLIRLRVSCDSLAGLSYLLCFVDLKENLQVFVSRKSWFQREHLRLLLYEWFGGVVLITLMSSCSEEMPVSCFLASFYNYGLALERSLWMTS